MIHNVIIYLIFAAYIGMALWYLVVRKRLKVEPYFVYLGLLVPAILLVLVGVSLGARQMPRHKVMIHGYRTPVTGPQQSFRIGSALGVDDIRFTYRYKDREQFHPGLLKIAFANAGSGFYTLTQTSLETENVVSIDGLPLRSLELTPDKWHRITFAAFNHDTQEKHILRVGIFNNRPVFKYMDRTYSKAFARQLMWGLVSFPYDEGQERHLGFAGRIGFPGLKQTPRELLKQASILRKQGRYYLAANDADIRLEGSEFPNRLRVNTSSIITLATRQLGLGRRKVAFRIAAPTEDGLASVKLLERYKKTRHLPKESNAQRLCFSANESYYTNAIDIIDPQFPSAGALVNLEGGGFVFRGNFLEEGKLYHCGKAVFSLDRVDFKQMHRFSWFAVMFLLSAIFLPPRLLKKEPLIAVVVSAAIFLLAFRQLLSFRAWQGPPYKYSIIMDSATAPFLFVMLVLVFTARFRIINVLRFGLTKIRNFFLRGHRVAVSKFAAEQDGLSIYGLAAFGMLIFIPLRHQIGSMFAILCVACVIASLFVGLLDKLENRIAYYSFIGRNSFRWAPAVYLLPFILGLVLLGPILGGKEVIAILPGRPRPDIFIQLFLTFVVAYFASVWIKEASRSVPNPLYILISFAVAIALPFAQGIVSEDMGFFVMVGPPLLLVMIIATWKLDNRIRALLVSGMVLLILSPLVIRFYEVPLDQVSMRRLAFFLDKGRIKAEYFFEYLAHLPILWSSNQGIFGGGFFHGDFYSSISETSVNDNVAAVFIQGELGAVGTILVTAVFGVLSAAVMLSVTENLHRRGGYRLWFLFGLSLMFLWTSTTMFLANLGYFPLTGKNLPFLGIDSLNDVVRYGLLTGFMVRYMDMLKEEVNG